jgi:hypothetical protein
LGTVFFKEFNPYLLAIIVDLISDFDISKSENNTLLAKKINVIRITKRFIFFMASRFNRFGATNFQNIFRNAKRIEIKSFKNVFNLHFIDNTNKKVY